jgi:hypothetical protein
MKIHNEITELSMNGIKESKDFGFKITPQAIQMFFKDIYKDPILACVRELACNAFDAHVLAKNPKTPFNVHIPTNLEPWFEIRDFGVGLSKEQMETLYSTFFESSKQGSNDFIGGLGIGSKSPLAYTDMFTATSFYEGVSYQFIVSKNELGVPTLNFVGEFPTKEPNGLSVNVPIKQNYGQANGSDIESFRKCVIKVFTRFETKPVLTGMTVEFPEIVYSSQKGDWGMRDNQKSGLDSSLGLQAIMGNIAYPISIDSLRLEHAAMQKYAGIIYSNSWRKEDRPFDIKFGIGTLSITPSREELQYDERTCKAITAAFDLILKEFLDEFKKTIEKAPDYFSACKIWAGVDSDLRSIISQYGHNVYNGIKLVDRIEFKVPKEEIEVDDVDKSGNPVKNKIKRKLLECDYLEPSELMYEAGNLKAYRAKETWQHHDPEMYCKTKVPLVIVKDEKIGNLVPKIAPCLNKLFFGGDYKKWCSDKNYLSGGSDNRVYLWKPSREMTDKELRKHVNTMLKDSHLNSKEIKVVYLSELVADDTLKPVRANVGAKVITYKFEAFDVETTIKDYLLKHGIVTTGPKISKSLLTKFIETRFINKDTFETKPQDFVAKDLGKGTQYLVTNLGQDPMFHGVKLTNSTAMVILYLLGVKNVIVVPPQRISKHIKENWENLNEKFSKEEVIKILNKDFKNDDVKLMMQCHYITTKLFAKHDSKSYMNHYEFISKGLKMLSQIPVLKEIEAWREDVKKHSEKFDAKHYVYTRMSEYVNPDYKKVTNTIDLLNNVFTHIKPKKDVKEAFLEGKLDILKVIEIPYGYKWNGLLPEEKAIYMKLYNKIFS